MYLHSKKLKTDKSQKESDPNQSFTVLATHLQSENSDPVRHFIDYTKLTDKQLLEILNANKHRVHNINLDSENIEEQLAQSKVSDTSGLNLEPKKGKRKLSSKRVLQM